MLKFLVVTTVGLPQHVPRKLYPSIFLCMVCTYVIFSTTCKGNFYHWLSPILFSNFSFFLLQLHQSIASASSFIFEILSTIKLYLNSVSEQFSTKFSQLLDSTKFSNHSIIFPKTRRFPKFSQKFKIFLKIVNPHTRPMNMKHFGNLSRLLVLQLQVTIYSDETKYFSTLSNFFWKRPSAIFNWLCYKLMLWRKLKIFDVKFRCWVWISYRLCKFKFASSVTNFAT